MDANAYVKDFETWNDVKQTVNAGSQTTHIRAGEIRWVSLGVNVGSEIDGKGVSFTRPALVLHAFGVHLVLVVPLSTKLKNLPGYVPFEWKGTTTSLCVHQLRTVSPKRIFSRKGRISEERLNVAKRAVTEFFSLAP